MFLFEDIHLGMEVEHHYGVSESIYRSFLESFGDRNPLHVDAKYASSYGFRGEVMHGAILNGFVSHFIGMVFPGKLSLLLSVDLRYSNPTYLGDSLKLVMRVIHKLENERTLVLTARFENLTQEYLAASGKVQVKFVQ